MIGDLIQRERLARGWSQRELAKHCGLSPRTIQRFERGRSKRPSVRVAKALAGTLGLDFDALMGLPPWADASLGMRIRILRKRMDMSAGDVAARAGVDVGCVVDWEAGLRVPKREMLDCLTLALCGRKAEVLEGEDPGWGGGASV